MSEEQKAPERIRVVQDADGFWTCREAVSGSQEYIRADLAAPSAPAGVEGLVVTDDMVEDGLAQYSEGGCSGLDNNERREVVRAILEAALATVLTALQAENERLRGERDMWRDQASANLQTGATCLEIKDATIARLTAEIDNERQHHANTESLWNVDRGLIEVLRRELAAAREALAWRPIETVDYGYKFLAAGKINGNWAIRICAFECGVIDQNGDKSPAEFWMPLPPAPTGRDDSEGAR